MVKSASEEPKVIKKNKKGLALKIIYILVLIALLAFGVFYFVKYNQLNNKYQAISDVKNKNTITAVSKLIDVPSDETPELFEVKDKTKLQITKTSANFFSKAENNDVVLIYTKANKAILFRPSENRIISTETAEKLRNINVSIIAQQAQQDTVANNLTQAANNVYIVSKNNPNTNVTTGVVVDVTGQQAEAAKQLAGILGYTVGALPEGEKIPEGSTFVVVAPAVLP